MIFRIFLTIFLLCILMRADLFAEGTLNGMHSDEMFRGTVSSEAAKDAGWMREFEGDSPVVSADGKRIAFSKGDNVYVLDLQKGAQIQVTSFGFPAPVDAQQRKDVRYKQGTAEELSDQLIDRHPRDLTWEPGSELLAFTISGKLFLLDLQGGDGSFVDDQLNQAWDLIAWSPVGRHLLMAAHHSDSDNLFLFDRSKSTIISLAETPGLSESFAPQWSMDGSAVIYATRMIDKDYCVMSDLFLVSIENPVSRILIKNMMQKELWLDPFQRGAFSGNLAGQHLTWRDFRAEREVVLFPSFSVRDIVFLRTADAFYYNDFGAGIFMLRGLDQIPSGLRKKKILSGTFSSSRLSPDERNLALFLQDDEDSEKTLVVVKLLEGKYATVALPLKYGGSEKLVWFPSSDKILLSADQSFLVISLFDPGLLWKDIAVPREQDAWEGLDNFSNPDGRKELNIAPGQFAVADVNHVIKLDLLWGDDHADQSYRNDFYVFDKEWKLLDRYYNVGANVINGQYVRNSGYDQTRGIPTREGFKILVNSIRDYSSASCLERGVELEMIRE